MYSISDLEILEESCSEDLANAILDWNEHNPCNFKPYTVRKIRKDLICGNGISDTDRAKLINIILGFKIDFKFWMNFRNLGDMHSAGSFE